MGICHLIVSRRWILTWTATLSNVFYIGNVVDLVDLYKDVYYDLLVCRHQELLSIEECFPEFGTVSDGTPGKASIEAVRQPRVTHTGHIICVLVYFQLHNKSIDGKEHAHHLITSCKSKEDGPQLQPSVVESCYTGRLCSQRGWY